MSICAEFALAAAQQRLDANGVAFTNVVNAGANGADDAAHLVSRSSAGLRRQVTPIGVQIGTADSLTQHPDDDLLVAWRQIRILDQAQSGVGIPGCATHVRLRILRVTRSV